MTRVTVRQVREHLSDLLDQVERGETIEVTRRGKAVARLVATPKKPLGLPDFAAIRAKIRVKGGRPTSEVVRQLRDEARY